MKKTSIIIYISFIAILIAICKPAKSQTYIPIPLDSTMWKVNYWATYPYKYSWVCSIFEYTSGDTIINGKHYTLIERIYDTYCLYHVTPPIRKAAIRQDSLERKVYIIRLPDSLTERILYDFTQTQGDTCNSVLYETQFGFGPLIIASVDSILINNKYHRRLNTYNMGCEASFIEGIGSTYGLIDRLLMFEGGNDLICVHDYTYGDLTIFPDSATLCDTSSVGITENKTEDYKLKVFPNPIIDQITFEYTLAIKNIQIYNLLGQEIYYLKIDNKNNVQLDIKGFAESIFIYRVETIDERVFIGKLVKE